MSTTTTAPPTTGANQKAIISKVLVAIDGSGALMDASHIDTRADLCCSKIKYYKIDLSLWEYLQ